MGWPQREASNLVRNAGSGPVATPWKIWAASLDPLLLDHRSTAGGDQAKSIRVRVHFRVIMKFISEPFAGERWGARRTVGPITQLSDRGEHRR